MVNSLGFELSQQPAVVQDADAIRERGALGLMRDHDDGLAMFAG